MILTVPSNSEVYMKPNTVFVSIERVGELPGMVEIDKSYTIKSIVALKPSGSSVTSHHHGEARDG